MIDSVSSPSQLLFCFWPARCWANVVTRARVYRAALLGMRLYRPPQQHAMRAYSYSPRRQAYQTALHGTTCLLSRGQGRQNHLPVLFLGGHGDLDPCLLPKRPPSRQGKVGSNLVSILSLAFRTHLSRIAYLPRQVVDPEPESQRTIGSTNASMVITIEPSLQPFTSPIKVASSIRCTVCCTCRLGRALG